MTLARGAFIASFLAALLAPWLTLGLEHQAMACCPAGEETSCCPRDGACSLQSCPTEDQTILNLATVKMVSPATVGLPAPGPHGFLGYAQLPTAREVLLSGVDPPPRV